MRLGHLCPCPHLAVSDTQFHNLNTMVQCNQRPWGAAAQLQLPPLGMASTTLLLQLHKGPVVP